DLDLYVTPAEVLAHLVQGGHRGGIPYVRARHVDHDPGQSLFGVVESIDQLTGGGEEHLTGDRVHAGAALGIEHAGDIGLHGGLAGEEHHRHDHADDDTEGQVAGCHDHHDGDDHDQGLGPGQLLDGLRGDAAPVEGHDRHEDHHRDQRGHGDHPHDVTQSNTQDDQEHTRQEGGDTGAGTGLDVDHGLADHRAPRHPPEEPDQHIGDALPTGLTGMVG